MAGPQDLYNPVPSIAPTTSTPNDYLSVQGNPSAFGAAHGQGLEKVGQGLQEAGEDIQQASLKWMQLHNDTAANLQSTTDGKAISDAEETFKAKYQGLNAQSHYKELQSQISDIMAKGSANLPSPYAQSQYLRDTRSFALRTYTNIANYIGDQVKTASKQGYDGALAAIRNNAAAHPADPAALDDAIHQTLEKVTQRAIFEHGDPTDPNLTSEERENLKGSVQADVQKEVGDTVYSTIMAAANPGGTLQNQVNGIQHAQAIFDKYKDAKIPGTDKTILDAPHLDAISRQLQNQAFTLDRRQNKQTVDGAVLDSVQSMHQAFQVDSLTGASSDNTPYVENKSDGISTTQQYVDRFKSKLAGRPFSVDNYYNAFVNTEGSHTTSAKGAVGPEQIEPGTFAGEAKLMGHPDWDINNTEERAEVAKHLIGRLWGEYHDPEKVAVAYFSGEGNVSKGSGKSSIPYGTPQTENFGEWMDNNQSRVIDEKTEEFKKNNPELASDPTVLTDFRHKLYTETSREMTEFKRQNKGDEDSVYGFLSGNNPTKQIIANPLMLESDPNIAPIWERFRQNNPKKAYDIETHLITANAKGVAMGLGTDYWKNFSEAAQGHITDSLALSGNVGWDKDAPLTNTGLSSLNPIIQRNSSPEGQATNQAIYKFLNSQRSFVTGTGTRPGVYTPELDLKWNQYLQVTLPRIEAGLKEGKTAAQMFDDPKGKDYVGGALGMFKPETDKYMKHLINTTMMKPGDVVNAVSGGPKPAGNQPTASVINSVGDLATAYKSGHVTADQVREYAKKHPDWFPETAPPVPQASFK